jgi:type I site-specific restriction-modification system R (restriction) subunit
MLGHAEHSGDLRTFITGGKKIIISTVQKFPLILDDIGSEHRGETSPSSSTRRIPARADAPPPHSTSPWRKVARR